MAFHPHHHRHHDHHGHHPHAAHSATGHSHAHAHHAAELPDRLNAAFAGGIALNIAFVLIEAFYGWQVNSLSLLADAGHNLSDVAGLLLAWLAMLAARRIPNARYTYGWQRASILAAFLNALLLLAAMGVLVWHAVGRLHSITPTDGSTMMWVAGVGIVVNTLTALLFMRSQSHDLNVRGAFLHMAADAAVSAGVVLAGWLYGVFGWAWLDPVVSLLIAVIIVVGTWGLLRESLRLLFDGVPQHIDPAAVQTWLASRAGVREVHDLHIWAMSTTDVALSAHLVMPDGCPSDDFLQATAEGLFATFHIAHPTLQVESTPLVKRCVQQGHVHR